MNTTNNQDTKQETRVLVLGANGRIARHTIDFLLKTADTRLTLYLRDSNRLKAIDNTMVRIVDGDIRNTELLKDAMKDQDIVYANLSGDMDKHAATIVRLMKETGLKRLIFVLSLGIYNEVTGAFGQWNDRMIGKALAPYRKAAEIIESSDLEYTILRPAWLSDDDEIDYELTQKGEPFKGTEVSRKSVGALVAALIANPKSEMRKSLGVNKPNTNGDKPSFY